MIKVDYKKIPNCPRKYRKASGLKQKDVAKILNLKSSGIISRWENGIFFSNPRNIFKLAALYWTLTDALFIDLIRMLKEKNYAFKLCSKYCEKTYLWEWSSK